MLSSKLHNTLGLASEKGAAYVRVKICASWQGGHCNPDFTGGHALSGKNPPSPRTFSIVLGPASDAEVGMQRISDVCSKVAVLPSRAALKTLPGTELRQ